MAVALELIGTEGYKQLSVRGLCRAAKLTDRYFYESFATVEDVLIALYQQETDKLAGTVALALGPLSVGMPVSEVIRKGLRAFFEGAKDPLVAKLIWLEVLGVSPRVDQMYIKSMNNFHLMILHLVKSLLPNLNLGPMREKSLAIAMVGAVNHSTMLWIINGFDTPIEELVEANATLMEGLAMKLNPQTRQ